MVQRWAVTGGAGYIGGHVVAALLAAGAEVVVVDDLSTGTRERVPDSVEFVHGLVADPRVLSRALPGATGVIHLAARTSVPESFRHPDDYYRANVADAEGVKPVETRSR